MKIISWNVNGIRAIHKKGALDALIDAEAPDVLCLQEIRCNDAVAQKEIRERYLDKGYPHVYTNTSKLRKGYSGTAILSKVPARHVAYDLPDDDTQEGRLIVATFDALTVACVYVPNSGQGDLKRLPYRIDTWEPRQRALFAKLQKAQPLVVCGDLNVAHTELDIHNPSRNRKHAGFTQEERQAFDALLQKTQLCDTFRTLHPNTVKYSWWSNFGNARQTNKGWRIDYILASCAASRIQHADILTHVMGSDHAPVTATLALALARSRQSSTTM